MILPSGNSTLDYSKDAQARGWGPGWPQCGAPSTIITVARSGQRLSVHPRIARLTTLLLNRMESGGYMCHTPEQWCWGASCRAIAGTSIPSNHSWNIAIDINAPANPYGTSWKRDIPDWFFDILRRFGWGLGWDYRGSVRDPMHAEFMGTPGDADVMTGAAEREFGTGVVLGKPFPLPQGYYYGPKSGPTESISGMAGEPAAWIEGLRTAQRGLMARGFGLPRYGADGKYGQNATGETHDATVNFQRTHGLVADGLIGAHTWASLGI